jgi:hypothetical protein
MHWVNNVVVTRDKVLGSVELVLNKVKSVVIVRQRNITKYIHRVTVGYGGVPDRDNVSVVLFGSFKSSELRDLLMSDVQVSCEEYGRHYDTAFFCQIAFTAL